MDQINKDEMRDAINKRKLPSDLKVIHSWLRALLDENAQQAAEIERLKLHVKNATYLVEHANARLQQSEEARKAAERERDEAKDGSWKAIAEMAERENAALRECLAWYAEKKNNEWDVDSFGEITHSEVMKDGGERARTLLAELDRKDTQPKEGGTNE